MFGTHRDSERFQSTMVMLETRYILQLALLAQNQEVPDPYIIGLNADARGFL